VPRGRAARGMKRVQVHVLASGSSGNAIFLDFGGPKILVDAGIGIRQLRTALAQAGAALKDLDAVLITHEHHDHIRGLAALAVQCRVPVYARPAVWRAMAGQELVPSECRRDLPDRLVLESVAVDVFPISHDAVDPVGFSFSCRGTKCTVATDLGAVTSCVRDALRASEIIILEANHDIEMLVGGPYPWFLKRRILGDKGHLSNRAAAETLAALPRDRRRHVFLAHLSRKNNCPQIASRTVSSVLERQGVNIGHEINLYITHHDALTSLIL